LNIGVLRKHISSGWAIGVAALIAVLLTVAVGVGVSHAMGGRSARARTNGAIAAGAISLHENASLRLIKNDVSVHEATGQVSGTLHGTLSLRIVVESAERMSASFYGSSHVASLSGKGISSYRVSGSVLSFKGTVAISHGTGSFAHASGSGVHIEGSMNRLRGTITMTINGRMYV
jgi:hypothetical protein